MSAGYTSQPLVVRPWCNHAATTVGYINDKGSFTPLADCSIGPSYAVDYEPLARLLASAPDLLAERNQLKALNAELAAALEDCLTFLSNDCQCNNSTPEQAHARAALEKNKETT